MLKDIITPPENTPENFYIRRIKSQIEELCTVYINNCKNIQDEGIKTYSTLKRETTVFRKRLTKFNEDYRQFVLGLNPKAKVPAITFGTYIVSMTYMVEKQFNKLVSPDSKLVYDDLTFRTCVYDELALIYAKNRKIYDFQFFTVICQIIADYFIIDYIPFKKISMIMDDILKSDITVLNNIISEFGIAEREKDNPKKDNAFPDKETVEEWLAAGYKRTYIKRCLSQQLGVSEKTIQRLLATYNLTEKKYTTKSNLDKQSW